MPLNICWETACGGSATLPDTTINSTNTGVAQWIESYASNVVDEGPTPSACAMINVNRVNYLYMIDHS